MQSAFRKVALLAFMLCALAWPVGLTAPAQQKLKNPVIPFHKTNASPAPAAGLPDRAPKPKVKKNSIDGLKYVWVPPGTFMMGCSPGDNECVDNESQAAVALQVAMVFGADMIGRRAAFSYLKIQAECCNLSGNPKGCSNDRYKCRFVSLALPPLGRG